MKPKQKASPVSGKYFLPIVLVVYLVGYVAAPQKTVGAFETAVTIAGNLLPVMVSVILLLGIFSYYFKPKSIIKYLGHGAGLRGWLIAIGGGILSHGSTYIWFPMLAEMRGHGARDGLIVTFIYVRAIKVPWLPVMIDYFGWMFTTVLTAVLIVAGVIQGIIMDYCARSGHVEN